MANTRQIKRRIHTAANISKITKAMEMVSASKMRRAQQQALASRAYSRAIQSSLHKVAQFTNASLHPLLAQHETGKDVVIIFSTDRGLCGGLNTNLFKSALHFAKEHPGVSLLAVGKKAVAFARRTGLPMIAQFTALPEKITVSEILPIREIVVSSFLRGELRSVHIVYMDFINTLSQQVNMVQLLPISSAQIAGASHGSDALHTSHSPGVSHSNGEYTFEPSPNEILAELLPYYIENTLYQTLLEAKASEHSARMVAMKNASDNAKDLVSELKLQFNKSRQAAITTELLDITTATMTVAQ